MMKVLDAITVKMIKFFSTTKIDTIGEYKNIVSCYFLFLDLQLIKSRNYDLSEIQRVLLLLNKELFRLRKDSKSLEKEGITFEWLREMESFSSEIYEELIALEKQPNQEVYFSLVKKVYEFCKEYEDLMELWKKEIHEYHMGTLKSLFVLFCLTFSLVYSSFLLAGSNYSTSKENVIFEEEMDLEEDVLKRALDKIID